MRTICLIDTNVILRFLVGDEPIQKHQADDFFKLIFLGKLRGLISISVINETLWILQGYYGMTRSLACEALNELLECEHVITLETKKSDLASLIREYATTGLDIIDLYLVHTAKLGDFWLGTFDKKLQKQSIVPSVLLNVG